MKFLAFSTALCLALIPGQSQANPITCTNGDLTRKIEVVYAEPDQPVPCEVIYDKSGEGSIEALWQANHEAGYCEQQAAALADKLTSQGWVCGTTNDAPGESAP